MILNFVIFIINGKEVFRLFSSHITPSLFARAFASLYNNVAAYETSFKESGQIAIYEALPDCICGKEYGLTVFKRLVEDKFEGDVFAAVTALQGTSLLPWEEKS